MSDFRTRPNFVGAPLQGVRMSMDETVSPQIAGSTLTQPPRPEEPLIQRVSQLEARLENAIQAFEKVANEFASRISHLQQVLGV